jgi:hypothetical protein
VSHLDGVDEAVLGLGSPKSRRMKLGATISLLFTAMRPCRARRGLAVFLLTITPLAAGNAQPAASAMAQLIPLVTRASPTATRGTLTEGYVTQPVVMAHASWGVARGLAMLNLEGLTLERGELTTGAYGEGYVDRRHPHAYVHELMVGVQLSRAGTSASLFAGRGFAPFGSDDPMVRPMVKYPVNHHLAQILERLVTVLAVRGGPIIGEIGVFNGDESLAPGAPPRWRRFGDSWSARLTALPIEALEIAASVASVESPEQRTGQGLDQRKSSVVARYAGTRGATSGHAMLEWEATSDRDRGRGVATLRSGLVEGAACSGRLMLAARVERTDRAEEEPLLDPFRVARPAPDLNNLGISRWLTVTTSVTMTAWRARGMSANPFVEVAHVRASSGTPAGVFDPELRYGSRTMWMYTAGLRLRAGARHDRMGRYGVSASTPAGMGAMGTRERGPGSEMSSMTHSSSRSCPF